MKKKEERKKKEEEKQEGDPTLMMIADNWVFMNWREYNIVSRFLSFGSMCTLSTPCAFTCCEMR